MPNTFIDAKAPDDAGVFRSEGAKARLCLAGVFRAIELVSAFFLGAGALTTGALIILCAEAVVVARGVVFSSCVGCVILCRIAD